MPKCCGLAALRMGHGFLPPWGVALMP